MLYCTMLAGVVRQIFLLFFKELVITVPGWSHAASLANQLMYCGARVFP